MHDDYVRSAKIVRWIDGDTVVLWVDLGFRIGIEETVRIAGINAPESKGSERIRGIAARAFAYSLAFPGDTVRVKTVKASEKFGRYLASITTAHGKDIAEELIKAGHALPWDGQGVRPI